MMLKQANLLILLTFALTSAQMTQQRLPKVILDVDPGVDDAHALLMMFAHGRNHSILALTVSQGNTFLSNATHNTLRLLTLADRLDIPIFIGDNLTLDGYPKNTSTYFGLNGFGNVPDDPRNFTPYLCQLENAAQALVRLVKLYPHEITLIALGTQTNVARAMKIYENFGKFLKKCIIMGGNYLGIGNETPKAEFNFLIDSKAANEVVTNLATDITIITWELCLNNSVQWSFYDHLVAKGTPKAEFIKKIGQFSRDRATRNNESVHYFADQIAVAVYLDESIILQSQQIVCSVETSNLNNNIGEMYVDWNSQVENKNIKLVTKINLEKVKAILYNSF